MRTESYFISLEEKIAPGGRRKSTNIYLVNKGRFFAWKRILDIVVSVLVIVFVLSWLTPVVALLVFFDSRGPIFFLQRRVGREGVTFTCIKFRSMLLNADSDRLQAIRGDKRITFIGNFLRRSNVDELPQFINVLLGHMSIIGPRPHMYADHYKFSSIVNGYEFRTLVRPGITGLAQVRGFAGPALDMESIFGRYQWDAFYVRNASFFLDMRILKKTILQQFMFWLKPIVGLFISKRRR